MLPEISHRCASCGASIRERGHVLPGVRQGPDPTVRKHGPPRDEETPKPSGRIMRLRDRALLLETANAATDIFNTADNPSASAPLGTPDVSSENQPAAAVEPAKTEAGVPAMKPSRGSRFKTWHVREGPRQFASRFDRHTSCHSRRFGGQRQARGKDSPRLHGDVRGSFLRSQPALCFGGPGAVRGLSGAAAAQQSDGIREFEFRVRSQVSRCTRFVKTEYLSPDP